MTISNHDTVAMTNPALPACGNCGKPAIMQIGAVPVCIDCEHKFQQSRYMQFAQNATMLNYADMELVKAVGMPHLSNQIQIPAAPIPPIHYNNQVVSISDSTVGSVNLGTAQDIQVTIGSMVQHGDHILADALSALTNAVLNDTNVHDAQKNELLEQIDEISKQAAAEPNERKQGIIKATFAALKDGAAAVTGIAGAWTAVEPLLTEHFHL